MDSDDEEPTLHVSMRAEQTNRTRSQAKKLNSEKQTNSNQKLSLSVTSSQFKNLNMLMSNSSIVKQRPHTSQPSKNRPQAQPKNQQSPEQPQYTPFQSKFAGTSPLPSTSTPSKPPMVIPLNNKDHAALKVGRLLMSEIIEKYGNKVVDLTPNASDSSYSRFFVDKWLSQFNAESTITNMTPFSIEMLARLQTAQTAYAKVMDDKADEINEDERLNALCSPIGRKSPTTMKFINEEKSQKPTKDLIIVACQVLDAMVDEMPEMPVLHELRKVLYRPIFMDNAMPEGESEILGEGDLSVPSELVQSLRFDDNDNDNDGEETVDGVEVDDESQEVHPPPKLVQDENQLKQQAIEKSAVFYRKRKMWCESDSEKKLADAMKIINSHEATELEFEETIFQKDVELNCLEKAYAESSENLSVLEKNLKKAMVEASMQVAYKASLRTMLDSEKEKLKMCKQQSAENVKSARTEERKRASETSEKLNKSQQNAMEKLKELEVS